MKFQVFILLCFFPLMVFSQPKKNELRINLYDSKGKQLANASVFISSLTGNKIYAKRSGHEFLIERVPPGYTAIEIFAKGYEPSGQLLGVARDSILQFRLYKSFENRLQGFKEGGIWRSGVGNMGDSFYRFVPRIIFVFHPYSLYDETVDSINSFCDKLGLVEVKNFTAGTSDTKIRFFKKKNNKPFDRYNCRELYEIRRYNSSLIAGNILYTGPSHSSGLKHRSANNISLISNIFYSPYYDYSSLLKRSLKQLQESGNDNSMVQRYRKDSAWLKDQYNIIFKNWDEQRQQTGSYPDHSVANYCLINDLGIGEGVMDIVLKNINVPKRIDMIHLGFFLPDGFELYYSK